MNLVLNSSNGNSNLIGQSLCKPKLASVVANSCELSVLLAEHSLPKSRCTLFGFDPLDSLDNVLELDVACIVLPS